MVNLTRIYTRTGDAGSTRLGDMSETTKTDLRLRAYADVDETNAHLGLVLATSALEEDVVAVLTHIQNDLFDVGADFCTPVVEDPEYPPLRIEPDYVDRLEAWCDLGSTRGARRDDERAGHQVPQPALGPALHPRAARQPRGRRRLVGARR